jgi:hypothetical protein
VYEAWRASPLACDDAQATAALDRHAALVAAGRREVRRARAPRDRAPSSVANLAASACSWKRPAAYRPCRSLVAIASGRCRR